MDDKLQVLSIWRRRKAYAVGEEDDDEDEEGETPSVYGICLVVVRFVC